MGKVYYKGYIISASKFQNIELSLGDLNNFGISKTANNFKKFLDTLNWNIFIRLEDELEKTENNEVIGLSNNVFSNIKQNINNTLMDCYIEKYSENDDLREIIFEVITTKNGDLYGKELYTGLLFPIYCKNISLMENLDLCESIIFNPKVANQNEVNDYYNRISGLVTTIFGVKKKIINRINKLYNKNVFNSDTEEIKEIEKDQITLKLENIEYMLAILKQKNIEAYEHFLKEYNKMLSSENQSLTLNPLTIQI